jgi:hypothetical protein
VTRIADALQPGKMREETEVVSSGPSFAPRLPVHGFGGLNVQAIHSVDTLQKDNKIEVL